MSYNLGDLRININHGTFIYVASVEDAIKTIKGAKEAFFADLEIYEEIDGEEDWNTWYDEKTGLDILEYMEEKSNENNN